MTEDEIIEMAAEIWNAGSFFPIPSSDDILRFAKLVAAKEREACAKVCESNVWSKDVAWWQEATKSEVSVESSTQCAKAIRARGQA